MPNFTFQPSREIQIFSVLRFREAYRKAIEEAVFIRFSDLTEIDGIWWMSSTHQELRGSLEPLR